MTDVIPIPNDRATEKLPIHVETIPDSFPERMQVRLDWNFIMEKWVLEVEHVEIDELVVQDMVSPYVPYWYEPYIVFSFIDPSGQTKEVTPTNLGDDVKLFAWPGPGGQEG